MPRHWPIKEKLFGVVSVAIALYVVFLPTLNGPVLIALTVGTIAISVFWALQIPNPLLWRASLAAAVGTRVILNSASDTFGVLTSPVVTFISWCSFVSAIMLAAAIVRLVWDKNPGKRTFMKGLGISASVFVSFTIFCEVYSTVNRYTAWYLADPSARVLVDGRPNTGYVHVLRSPGQPGAFRVITRRCFWRAESYYFADQHTKSVWRWYWTAPRSPALAAGDILPPDSFRIIDGGSKPEPAPDPNLKTGPNWVEFSADDGKRIRAEW